MKSKATGTLSVREQKAAALDKVVKTELAKKRASDAAKMSNLRALRLARDAEVPKASAPIESRRKSWGGKAPPARSED